MWDWVLESFAEMLGVTRRSRRWLVLPLAGACLWTGIVAILEGGPRGIFAFALFLLFAVVAASQVLRGRAALLRAARLPLTDPKQPPTRNGHDLPPTARALYRLAGAVSSARRGDFFEAAQTLEKVDRDRLRRDEARLLDAARAMISLGLGDPRRAATQAAKALPTGSEDIDFHLGRMLVTEAWGNAASLRKIDETWASEGITPGTKQALPRLRAIVRLRIDTSALEALEAWEAKSLADEARAVGDDALAADLEARSRPGAYR
jgi:hypothetical protein